MPRWSRCYLSCLNEWSPRWSRCITFSYITLKLETTNLILIRNKKSRNQIITWIWFGSGHHLFSPCSFIKFSSGGSRISLRGRHGPHKGGGAWTPEAVTFRKFCMPKRKNLDPWGACAGNAPLDSPMFNILIFCVPKSLFEGMCGLHEHRSRKM